MVQQISSKKNCNEAIGESNVSQRNQKDSSSETSNTKFVKIVLLLSFTSIVFSLASLVCVLTLSYKQPSKSDCRGSLQKVVPDGAACIYPVRFIQDRHIGSENYGDIGYNFLIGGDGIVYEGRGWFEIGAFLRGLNSKSIGVTFIGDYRHLAPSMAQLDVLDALLVNGTKNGYLTQDYKLHGSCQFQATESPGKLLFAELKKHSHWSDILD